MIYLQENTDPELVGLVDKVDDSKVQFLFSPAHIEEIAAMVMHHSIPNEVAEKRLCFLSKITKKTALLPFPRCDVEQSCFKGVYLSKENPESTYARVISNYSLNVIPETHQREKIEAGERHQENTGIGAKKMNNLDVTPMLEESKADFYKAVCSIWLENKETVMKDYIPYSKPKIEDLKFDFLRGYFPLHEAVVEKIFERLEKIRFWPDTAKQYLSGLHDVTHAIYAAYCDIFVTNDMKLKKKTEVAFKWLGAEAQVFDVKDFKAYLQ